MKEFKKSITISGKKYDVAHIVDAIESFGYDHQTIPKTLKTLFENLLRHSDDPNISKDDLKAILDRNTDNNQAHEIPYRPSRVLMQDFTGVPGVVDLAAMRDVLKEHGKNPEKVNPQWVDLVIDHSVQVIGNIQRSCTKWHRNEGNKSVMN